MKFLWLFDIDAVWTLIPLVSVLWAWGGSGPKMIRKIGVPASIVLAALSLGVNWILCLLTAGALFGTMTLSYGDKWHQRFGQFYWIWLYIVSGLWATGLSPLVLFHRNWIGLIIGVTTSSISFGTLTITSQKLNFPQWKFVEIAVGAMLGLTAALLLQ